MGSWEKVHYQHPFGILEVSRVGLLEFGHSSSLLDYLRNTLLGEERMLLVDSASNPILRLEQTGLDFNDLTDIIITHFHPDHASGIPLLLMNMWLMGRRRLLNIHGLPYTLGCIESLMDLYKWSEWPGFFPLFSTEFHARKCHWWWTALILQSMPHRFNI